MRLKHPESALPEQVNTLVTRRFLVYAVIAAALTRLMMLGMYPLMDTTEARYAEIARIMVELNDWVTPWFDYDVPFWGKPPLSFWLTAASFKLFGINEFAARLPHWIAGMVVVWLAWGMSARRSRQEALYTSALLLGSALFYISAGAVMTDMVLTIGTTLVMRGFWLGLHGADGERQRESWLLFVGLGIGLLAKGPVAVVLAVLPIGGWTIVTGNLALVWRGLPWVRGSLLTLAIAAPWYVLAEIHTPGFLNYFLAGEHWHRFVTAGWAGDLYGRAHDFPRGSIWLFLMADLLPWTLLIPVITLSRRKNWLGVESVPSDRNRQIYLLFWGLAPAVFFTAAGNVLWAYVLPGIPALAIFASSWLAHQSDRKLIDRVLTAGVAFTLLASALFIVILPIVASDKMPSAKEMIIDYENRRAPGQPLVIFGKRSFSADFYSQGEVVHVSDAPQLEYRLRQGPTFVAVRNKHLRIFPTALLETLEPVSEPGSYTLFFAE